MGGFQSAYVNYVKYVFGLIFKFLSPFALCRIPLWAFIMERNPDCVFQNNNMA